MSHTKRHGDPRSLRQHGAFVLVLLAYLCLGVLYSVVNPLFESPDEVWHYEYVRWIAQGHGLPVSDLVSEMPWRQEGSQPPLYYLLAAGLTFWADSSDAASVIRLNPHAAIGQAGAVDNKNVMAHSAAEALPYRGAVLAAHLIRLFSVLLGSATLTCTYLTALAAFPEQRALASLAAVVVAFNPQFVFLSASVNNDNLVVLLSGTALLLGLRIWRSGGSRSQLVLLGLVAGLAALSKLNGLVLLPFIALVLVEVAWRSRSWRSLGRTALLVGLPVLVVAGWWYWRNWRLYSDPLGLAAMYAVLPARQSGPDLAEVLARLQGVWRSSWAVFGWFNVAADPWLYALYSILSLAGLAGLLLLVLRWARRADGRRITPIAWLALWTVVVASALMGWSQKRYPQGRLLFPAISAFAVLLAAGLTQGGDWARSRWNRVAIGLLAGVLFALCVWAPFRYIIPAYAAPRPLVSLPAQASPAHEEFGGQIRLLGYESDKESARPGETMHLTLYWQATASIDRDYSVYIHLVDDLGIIVAQRDSYPGGGNAITSEWPVTGERANRGTVIADHHDIAIPATAPAPVLAELRVGLYNYHSHDRLLTSGGEDGISLGTISLEPAGCAGEPGTPVDYDFEGRVALVGFDVDRRLLLPGETLHLTLYWQTLSPLDCDYTAFAHLLLPPEQVWAGHDALLLDGQAATSSWEPGRLVANHYELVLPPETPAGVYEVEVGLYSAASGTRLRVDLSDRGIVLAKVKVDG